MSPEHFSFLKFKNKNKLRINISFEKFASLGYFSPSQLGLGTFFCFARCLATLRARIARRMAFSSLANISFLEGCSDRALFASFFRAILMIGWRQSARCRYLETEKILRKLFWARLRLNCLQFVSCYFNEKTQWMKINNQIIVNRLNQATINLSFAIVWLGTLQSCSA